MSGEPQATRGAPLAAEQAARANLYALIGRLFYDAPDSILLAEICGADAGCTGGEGPVADAWRALRDACKSAFPAVVKQEYDTLFVGVGRAEVTPYTSHYVADGSPDHHLVRLREQMARWGLARREGAGEAEDHVSGICDIMRLLAVEDRPAEEQWRFFSEFVYPVVLPFLDAVRGAASAVYYRHVAVFARAFLDVEKTALEMRDS